METRSPALAPPDRLREEVRSAVKEIIASIKMIGEGPESIPDDAPLFGDGVSEPSPLEMDSLDALDLALALKERFDPEGERFEEFLNGEMDPQELGTVTKITDYVLSLAAKTTGSQTVEQVGTANEQVPSGYQ
jgi:acyl carrier protein